MNAFGGVRREGSEIRRVRSRRVSRRAERRELGVAGGVGEFGEGKGEAIPGSLRTEKMCQLGSYSPVERGDVPD